MNISFEDENLHERGRLETLLSKLSGTNLSRNLESGWSVAETLVHLAFWDLYYFFLLKKWEVDAIANPSLDVDSINQAILKLHRGLSEGTAAKLAVDAAKMIDGAVAELPRELSSQIEHTGKTRILNRSIHRREHLDQIEQLLGSVGVE